MRTLVASMGAPWAACLHTGGFELAGRRTVALKVFETVLASLLRTLHEMPTEEGWGGANAGSALHMPTL